MALTRYGGSGGSGDASNIPDAPADSVLYGRKNNAWAQAVEPSELAAHLADAADAHAASAITNTPAGGIAATTVQAAINELDSEKAASADLTAHINDTTDAHAASAITNTPAGNIAATTVQAALNELDSEKAATADLTAHINDTTDAHAASAITNTPAGGIAATTVQAALNELDSEKAPSASPTFTGTVTVSGTSIPQNSQSTAYTLVASDANKHILHPSADTTARTFTIPANSSVAYSIGTAITFVNQNSAGTLTIAITTDTMRLAGAGTTGSRTLAANGIATALKVTATEWIISGTGLS